VQTKILFSALVGLVACACAIPAGASVARTRHQHTRMTTNAAQVVVARGQSLEVAYMPDLTGQTSGFAPSIGNAVAMAVAAHPSVRGFPLRINVVDTPCGEGDAADLAAATTAVVNTRNAAVIGSFCSTADTVALPVFESAGLVTLSGSTTDPSLPQLGPDVYNSVDVSDSCCPYVDLSDPWYATVSTLPRDLAWRQAYTQQFGAAPGEFADLYYDATSLLIRTLQTTSSIDSRGDLVLNRAALAHAVRNTTNYPGVTCTVTLDPATGFRINDPTALTRCAH